MWYSEKICSVLPVYVYMHAVNLTDASATLIDRLLSWDATSCPQHAIYSAVSDVEKSEDCDWRLRACMFTLQGSADLLDRHANCISIFSCHTLFTALPLDIDMQTKKYFLTELQNYEQICFHMDSTLQ